VGQEDSATKASVDVGEATETADDPSFAPEANAHKKDNWRKKEEIKYPRIF